MIVPLVAAPACAAGTNRTAAASEPLYMQHCMLCHGIDGRGIEGLGANLADSRFVARQPVADLVAFLRTGRLPDDPASVSGRPMPGFAYLQDADLLALAEYLRRLAGDPAPSESSSSATAR